MWKSIKNFFQSIADRTGISWIARKISSGWNWLLSSKANTAQENTSPERPSDDKKHVNDQSKDNLVLTFETPSVSNQQTLDKIEESMSEVNNDSEITTTDQQRALSQELVANEPKAVGELKFVGEKLLLVTTSDQFAKCKDYRNTQSANPDELLMFIKCGANEYRIAGNSTEESISIKSILRKNKNGDYINGNIVFIKEDIDYLKKILGLEDGVAKVKVDDISNQPFEGTALEQHNLNPTTAQQMVNNEEVTTESEEFHDAEEELDSDYHDAPDAPEDFCNQPRSVTGEPEAQISNPSKVGNGYY